MSTILSTAMFASFKSNGDSSESPRSSLLSKRRFFVRSSSQSSSGSRSTASTSSKGTTSSYRGNRVAMGDLSEVLKDDDDFDYHTKNNHGLDIENWKSFHRRFGTKPKKPARRVPPRVPFMRDNDRRTTSKDSSTQEPDSNETADPNLWSSVVHAVKGCTSPMWEHHASAPISDENDEWDEVPSYQRHGILDIRQENGQWHFLEDGSTSSADSVVYQLME